MDDLRTTLLTLSPDDRRDLGRFLQRQQQRAAGRLDSRLYELLLSAREYRTEQLITKLYPDEPNPVAYYALRKRLMRHLTEFLLLRQNRLDPTAAASVRGQLTLAQYLFDVGIPRLAWATLRKAEKLARTNEQFEPLNAVYNLQIQQAHTPYAEPLPDILARRHANKKAADEEERANIADSLLRKRLHDARTELRSRTVSSAQEVSPFEEMVQQVLREYDLQEAFARSPSLLCRLMGIARSAMLMRGDFRQFAGFLQRCYHLMERRHGFRPAHRRYQLRLLYMLAHAYYRARQFEESVACLAQGRAVLSDSPQRQNAEFGPRYTLLLAANLAFLSKNAESIALLQHALHATPPLSAAAELTARLQLAFHYFAGSQFGQANQTLISIGHTDHWLEQHMGLEWLLAKVLSEMLVQFELGHDELGLARLRAIERLLCERFPAPEAAAPATPDAPVPSEQCGPAAGGPFQYVLRYLALVRELIQRPHPGRRASEDFLAAIDGLTAVRPHRRDDLQVRSFYSWLRARAQGRPFYEVLLEVTNGSDAHEKSPDGEPSGLPE